MSNYLQMIMTDCVYMVSLTCSVLQSIDIYFSKKILRLVFYYVSSNVVKTSESSLCMRNTAIEITDSL